MLLSVQDALETIYAEVTRVGTELVPLENALGRIASKRIDARYNLPRFDNSAMDGYGVKCEDAGNTIDVTDIVYAGDDKQIKLKKHQAFKIMTGAAIQAGVETIVPVEDVLNIDKTRIKLPEKLEAGKFIRKVGEDIARGAAILSRGERIGAYHIALLASQGVTHIDVYRKVQVAIFSTGNELKAHFETITGHQLFNSNTPMLQARCETLGCEVRFIRSSADTPDALQDAIENALQSDVVLTSGGISMGDKDFTKKAFKTMGADILFEGVSIKPGKPTTVAKKGHRMIINLPGNPLAAMVNFELFVRAALRKMSGLSAFRHGTLSYPLARDVKLKPKASNVKLGYLTEEGFVPFSSQKPGMLSPLPHSEGMVLFEPQKTEAKCGEQIRFIPITWEKTAKEERIFS